MSTTNFQTANNYRYRVQQETYSVSRLSFVLHYNTTTGLTLRTLVGIKKKHIDEALEVRYPKIHPTSKRPLVLLRQNMAIHTFSTSAQFKRYILNTYIVPTPNLHNVLFEITIVTLLWDICTQCIPKSEATEHGV